MNYWLFKSEPMTFSIDNLASHPKQIAPWDGVRNYQVRNMLRDQIKAGDRGFFYHSSCQPPGIVGIIEVIKSGYPELGAAPWYVVDVKLVEKFQAMITLECIKSNPKLKNMLVARKGSRLSITPVTAAEWRIITEEMNSKK